MNAHGSNRRYSFDYLDACVFEGRDFVGIVGHQLDGLDAEVGADGGGQAIIARVDSKAKGFVCLDGVSTFVLQLVGAEFVDDADATAFFHFVDNEATTVAGDGREGKLKLLAAIAAQTMEDVSGEALGMDPQDRGRAGLQVSENDGHGFFPFVRMDPFEPVDSKLTKLGGEICFGGVN